VGKNNIITTFAGAAWTFPDGIDALNAPIGPVDSVFADANDSVIFASRGSDVVMRINPDGTVKVIAGNGIRGFSGDGGAALKASLNQPVDVVADARGNLYIYDGGNARIRRVAPDGTISTYAGSGAFGYAGDGGPALKAQFGSLARLALDASGSL